jgi:hypothetical protein
MAMRIIRLTVTFRYFVGFHSRAICCDISDLAVTIRRSPFAGTIVLGPFLLSLGLRLRLRSNLPAGEREPHLYGR